MYYWYHQVSRPCGRKIKLYIYIYIYIYVAMKKWEQLQLTLNNSKSEGGPDKAMRVRVLEFEFVLVLFWRDQRKNSIYWMSSTRIYSSTFWMFEVSYRESNFFMRLQNFLLKFQQNSSKRFEELIFSFFLSSVLQW